MTIRYVPSSEISRGRPSRAVVRVGLDGNNKMVSVVNGRFNQLIQFQERGETNHWLFTHDDSYASEITESFVEVTGLDIPSDFDTGTDVYNVPGILRNLGVPVPFVVMRQQIFLSASVVPIEQKQTARYLYHALGNALWNYLDSRVWRNSSEEKRRYADIRRMLPPSRELNHPQGRVLHQQNMFYVAGEDIRYLFGSAEAGRGQWDLNIEDQYGNLIQPPPPEAIDFWRGELARYGSRYSEAPQENVPAQEEKEVGGVAVVQGDDGELRPTEV